MSLPQCRVCLSCDTRSLAAPYERSLVSDGLPINQPLNKLHCNACGSLTGLNDFTLESYNRSDGLSDWEKARHKAVASGLSKLFTQFGMSKTARILEVGAGNFATSAALKAQNPGYAVTSLEPFPENEDRPDDITCVVSGIEAFDCDQPFNVIFSNQVMEHLPGPVEFLNQQARLMAKDGHIIICCPTQDQVSNELMFVDHLFHFTQSGMEALVRQAGSLVLESASVAPWDELTHVYILRKTRKALTPQASTASMTPDALFEARQRLLAWWGAKEAEIINALSPYERVKLFGAGELSQLIEIYMPQLFSRVNGLVVTQSNGARSFDRPIYALDAVLGTHEKIVLSIRPEAHDAVAQMLVTEGIAKDRIIRLYKTL